MTSFSDLFSFKFLNLLWLYFYFYFYFLFYFLIFNHSLFIITCFYSLDFSFFLFFIFRFLFSVFHFSVCRALEDESLKGLFRLLSRSSQALSLLDLLRCSNEEKKMKIKWNKFGKLSFRSLVVSQSVHDEVKRMLLDLVGDACKSGESNTADFITSRLTTDCFQV